MVYAFGGFVLLGTILLLMPFMHHGDGFTPFIVALFIATSAVTVTGLVVVDTATYWSVYGQVVILGLMYIGGLGFMTIATFLLVLIGQRVTLAQRLLVRESMGINQLGGLVRLTVIIVIVATIIQVIGFVALFLRFLYLYQVPEAAWQAVFHSVSAFNNGGFSILREEGGLIAFNRDATVLGILGLLSLIGALSYWVLVDIFKIRKFSLFTLNSKLVLVFTGIAIVVGTLTYFGFEYRNPDTLGPLPIVHKLSVSLFSMTNGRTGGLSPVDMGQTLAHTNLMMMVFMFIGGASASVAGGIKINTFAVIAISIMLTMRGRSNVSAFGREIPLQQVRRAMVIGAVATAFLFLVTVLLAISEPSKDFLDLFFEAVSAFGTVGLSTGITPDISDFGHIVLTAAMFIGRLGPMTIGLTMAFRSETDMFRFAQERVTIG